MREFWISDTEGRVPTVNQLELALANRGYNRRDAKDYGLRIVGGVKSVVLLAQPGVENHSRLHSMVSAADHAPVGEADRGKIPHANELTGEWELIALPASSSMTLDAASATFSGISVSLTAGENLVKGNLCYVASNGAMMKTDADALATCLGIAIATDTIAASAPGLFLLLGFINGYSGLTPGGAVYASVNPGAISQAVPTGTDDVVQIVGVAVAPTIIYFKPSLSTIERA